MLDGSSVLQALRSCGITHVVWVPDSEIGQWETSLNSDPSLNLVRVCREGEAIGVAAGLLLGGKQPIVMIQCTGLFEAGDALRNVVHDMKLPLFLLVGVRSWNAFQSGRSGDTCPPFTVPIIEAWKLPHRWLDEQHPADDLAAAYRQSWQSQQPCVVLLAE